MHLASPMVTEITHYTAPERYYLHPSSESFRERRRWMSMKLSLGCGWETQHCLEDISFLKNHHPLHMALGRMPLVVGGDGTGQVTIAKGRRQDLHTRCQRRRLLRQKGPLICTASVCETELHWWEPSELERKGLKTQGPSGWIHSCEVREAQDMTVTKKKKSSLTQILRQSLLSAEAFLLWLWRVAQMWADFKRKMFRRWPFPNHTTSFLQCLTALRHMRP